MAISVTSILPETSKHKHTTSCAQTSGSLKLAVVVDTNEGVVTLGSVHSCFILNFGAGGNFVLVAL